MTTITINVKDEVNKDFREAVEKKMGHGKGVLGKAIEEAMQRWASEEEERKLREEALATLKKGIYKLPKGYKFKREEAYEDRIRKIIGSH